jgi:hypothetical protein
MRNAYKIFIGKSEAKGLPYLRGLEVYGRIIT